MHGLRGYLMYSLGGYPCIVKADRQKEVVVEMYRVPNDIASSVRSMEIGAGYIERVVSVDGKKGSVYVYTMKPGRGSLVPNGDWASYKEEVVQ